MTSTKVTRRDGGLLHNSDFLKFWGGETLSLFGTQITLLALPLTAVLVLNSTTGQVGLLRFMQLLPYLLFSLPFGAIADGRARRPLMVAANAVRLVLIALVPLLSFTGHLTLAALYVVTFGAGLAAVTFDVCWLSYVPHLVRDRGQLVNANGKLGTTASAADIAGPGLAGALVQLLTAPYALVVDAASYAMSLISLLLIRAREVVPVRSKRSLRDEVVQGLQWVFRHQVLRTLALLGGAYNFVLTYMETVFLVYAVRTLSFGAGRIGFILSVGAAGGLVGAVAASSVSRRFGIGPVYTASVVVAFSSWVLIPAAAGPEAVVTGIFVCAFFLTSLGLGTANVIVLSLRQTVTPSHLMARMNAVMRMLMFGVAAVGGPAAGLLAAWFGLHPALWVGAVASIVALVPLFPSDVVRLKVLPAPPESTATVCSDAQQTSP